MDIDLLSKMVGELILDNDEVALPGVGTFVAELMPSTFSDKGYTINPPYRRLSFRQRESSDNSLAELYARSNDVDVRTAASILGPFLKELKETLKVRKTIVFPGLGRLRATRENNFFFVPDEDLNIYPEGFGLEPVSLKTHVETEDEMRAAVASLQHIMGEPVEGADSFAALGMTEEAAPVMIGGEDPGTTGEAEPETAKEEIPVEEEPVPDKTVELEEDDDEEEEVVVPKKKWGRKVLIAAAGVVAAVVLALVVFLVLARVAPGFIDSILYTQEELDIIRQMAL